MVTLAGAPGKQGSLVIVVVFLFNPVNVKTPGAVWVNAGAAAGV